MHVRKMTSSDLDKTYCCIKEMPPGASWTEGLPESRNWLGKNLGKYVEGYHLLDDGEVVGHIHYATSEKALVPYEIEPGVACIYCTEMLREYAHKGYGRMMFDYMKNDLKKQGYKGIMVPATSIKEFMHYEQFQKQGFNVIMEHAPFTRVMYFPLTKQSIKIKPIDLSYQPSKDRVEITLFSNSFCPVGSYMYHVIKQVAQGFGDKVKIVEIQATLGTIKKYGTTDPLINGKIKILGPASETDVKRAIQEELDQFKR
jgi:hypothetical protein